MKKWVALLSVWICMSLGLGAAFGATLEKEAITLQNSVTGEIGTYKIVNTLVNGKELDTDVPGFIIEKAGKQTVYVPVSTIYRSMNASVSWSEKAKRLTIKQGKNTYIFDIGKTYVNVNGKNVDIENKEAILLVKYAGTDRTMVPVSVIAAQMGMEIKYQPEIRMVNISQPLSKIQGMTYNALGKYKEVRIKTSTEISTTSYTIDGTAYGGKNKVIVEFQNSQLEAGVTTALAVNDAEISRIDLVNPAKVPPRVRLEVELNTPRGFYSYYDKQTKEQVIQIVNTLKDIQYGKVGDYHVVTLKTAVMPNISVKKLQGKLVVDFLDTRLTYNNGSASEKTIQNAGLIHVAYSQFDPSYEYKAGDQVSRVVLNFADANQQEKVFVKEGREGVEIYLEGDPDKGLNYEKLSSAAGKLEFLFQSETAVSKVLNAETNELTVTIPKNALLLENVFRNFDDNIVEYIDVNANVDPANYVIKAKLATGTMVYDNSNPQLLSIAFINEQIKGSENRKTLIVLDAGHGGSDPGTIGKFTGVKEKDLALNAVMGLKDALEQNGYEVALTRSSDVRVELLQRTDFANEVNADLFVSIHYNAVDKTDVNGIEVLYYPDAGGVKQKLAKVLHDELVAATGAKARGTVSRPLLVVPRETKMPSALVEMGFVSNRDEEIRVQNPDYLSVQVKAIVEGVNRYLRGR